MTARFISYCNDLRVMNNIRFSDGYHSVLPPQFPGCPKSKPHQTRPWFTLYLGDHVIAENFVNKRIGDKNIYNDRYDL